MEETLSSKLNRIKEAVNSMRTLTGTENQVIESVPEAAQTKSETLTTTIAEKEAIIIEKEAIIVEKEAVIEEKDKEIEEKDKEIEELKESGGTILTGLTELTPDAILRRCHFVIDFPEEFTFKYPDLTKEYFTILKLSSPMDEWYHIYLTPEGLFFKGQIYEGLPYFVFSTYGDTYRSICTDYASTNEKYGLQVTEDKAVKLYDYNQETHLFTRAENRFWDRLATYNTTKTRVMTRTTKIESMDLLPEFNRVLPGMFLTDNSDASIDFLSVTPIEPIKANQTIPAGTVVGVRFYSQDDPFYTGRSLQTANLCNWGGMHFGQIDYAISDSEFAVGFNNVYENNCSTYYSSSKEWLSSSVEPCYWTDDTGRNLYCSLRDDDGRVLLQDYYSVDGFRLFKFDKDTEFKLSSPYKNLVTNNPERAIFYIVELN